jgi:hypothetical protein
VISAYRRRGLGGRRSCRGHDELRRNAARTRARAKPHLTCCERVAHASGPCAGLSSRPHRGPTRREQGTAGRAGKHAGESERGRARIRPYEAERGDGRPSRGTGAVEPGGGGGRARAGERGSPRRGRTPGHHNVNACFLQCSCPRVTLVSRTVRRKGQDGLRTSEFPKSFSYPE